MPIYEYRCAKCAHTFTKLQKISDDPIKTCPACNEPAAEKLVSAPAFHLKGGGWYATDFKDQKPKPSTETPKTEGTPKETTAKKDDT